MKTQTVFGLILTACLALSSGSASAEVTFTMIGEGQATDISADGLYVAGNTMSFESFRWNETTGFKLLGMASSLVGSMAGTPDISDDGRMVSATIAGVDTTYVTQGRWTEGLAWQETMPPLLPHGTMSGDAYGSAWGLSGDGGTVVGLMWHNLGGGTAHASSWTEAGGLVDLGSLGHDSRANEANYDGTVIVGWCANPDFGTWWPAVWDDGELTILEYGEYFLDATTVTADGNFIAGMGMSDDETLMGLATWTRNGETWDREFLGALPGTFAPPYGLVHPDAITPDGTTIVGMNRFDWNNRTGFIWTRATGMVDVVDFLADNGITPEPNFIIHGLTGISDDGTVIVGLGQDTFFPYNYRSFLIEIDNVTDVPESANLAFELGTNYPNPFNPSTTIPVTLARDGQVSLEIYDVAGRCVRTLHAGSLSAGEHAFTWDGRNGQGVGVASGTYYARMNGQGGASASQRMVLIK